MASPEGSPLPLPRPKSPPELYGKRRELAKVVMLEREIGFLQEELKSVEVLQPASFCVKEVADYVVANPEPLITVCKKTRKSCGFWKWLCGNLCFNMPCICCCSGCSVETPDCCCSVPDCCSCSLPKCSCAFKPRCPPCLKQCSSCCCPNCNSGCCNRKCPDCSSCCCECCWPAKCECSCPKFPKCSTRVCCSLYWCYYCCQCC